MKVQEQKDLQQSNYFNFGRCILIFQIHQTNPNFKKVNTCVHLAR